MDLAEGGRAIERGHVRVAMVVMGMRPIVRSLRSWYVGKVSRCTRRADQDAGRRTRVWVPVSCPRGLLGSRLSARPLKSISQFQRQCSSMGPIRLSGPHLECVWHWQECTKRARLSATPAFLRRGQTAWGPPRYEPERTPGFGRTRR